VAHKPLGLKHVRIGRYVVAHDHGALAAIARESVHLLLVEQGLQRDAVDALQASLAVLVVDELGDDVGDEAQVLRHRGRHAEPYIIRNVMNVDISQLGCASHDVEAMIRCSWVPVERADDVGHVLDSAIPQILQLALGLARDRGGSRRDDGAGFLIGEQLESDTGADHVLLPLKGNLYMVDGEKKKCLCNKEENMRHVPPSRIRTLPSRPASSPAWR
jgi:hypothetical protein